jgi:hypothetical protein
MEKDKVRELRRRFVDDYGFPIQIYRSPYFEYFLSLYENHLGTETKWNEFNDLIKNKYSGKNSLFLEDYYNARNHIITSIENSDSYKQFNSCNMGDYALTDEEFKKLPKTSIYLEPNDGKVFLSVDMKQANFNTLKYHNKNIVRNTDTYDNFIIEMLGKEHRLIEYFQKSKYTRQIIFGKLNMSRNMTIQKYIMSIVYQNIKHAMEQFNIRCFKPYAYNADELIFEVVDEYPTMWKDSYLIESMNKIKNFVLDNTFNFELFKLGIHKFINSNDGKLVVYIKSETPYSPDGKVKIKSCPSTYYAQVHKLLINQEIIENDLVFYHEHQLAKFLEPIRFVD